MNTKPDPLKKTTRIPFRFVDGKFLHFKDRTEITELVEGCIGEIVIENFKINDKARVEEFNAEVELPFLSKGTKLLARVNSAKVPQLLRDRLSDESTLIGDVSVEIILEEDLSLQCRGTKPARLGDCKCSVPALRGLLAEDRQPFTVNQAYTRLSEIFEPDRLSYGGSVFNQVYFYDETLGWQPLSVLRERRQIEFELQRLKTG